MPSQSTCAVLFLLLLATVGTSNGKREQEKTVKLPNSEGTVARMDLADPVLSDTRSEELHFCVFENGTHDLIYVGAMHGMWASGEFDLSFKDKVVYTGKIKHLLYEGEIIDMGDVIESTGYGNSELAVTRVVGTFK